MRILFVSPEISKMTGGGVFSNTIHDALKAVGCELQDCSFPLYKNNWEKLKHQLRGYTMGMNASVERKILKRVNELSIDTIIINGSRFGGVIRKIKKTAPRCKVVCIFHNVEYDFVLNAIRLKKSIVALLTLFVTGKNEKDAIDFSDIILALNERDSSSLQRRYGRKADAILPLCLEDRFDATKVKLSDGVKKGAFIGSNFYANNRGVKWFCENVSNRVDCKILIVGKGFDSEKEYFMKFPNVELVGTVPYTDPYYYDVDFIVSPIFDGSGMKTKTAEALMFGKTIFGTKEAFEGYDLDYQQAGALCNDEEDFVRAINSFDVSQGKFNKYSRNVFLDKYSKQQIVCILNKVLNI